MAKKKTLSPPAAAPPGAVANVRVIVDAPDGSEPYYVNHIEVGATKFDFSLLCARIPTKPSAESFAQAAASGELHIPATVQVVIPASLVGGLVRALTIQKEQYEKINGPIPDLGANAPKPPKAESNDKPAKKTH